MDGKGIRCTLEDLVEVTECSPEFLDIFIKHKILGTTDITELNQKREHSGPEQQTKRFYEILQTRGSVQVQHILILAIYATNQTEAANLMSNGKISTEPTVLVQCDPLNSKIGAHGDNKISSFKDVQLNGKSSEKKAIKLAKQTNGYITKKVALISNDAASQLREVQATLKKAKHKNIANYLNIDVFPEKLYLKRQFFPNSLGWWTKTKGVCILPAKVSELQIMRGMTEGLAHLHSKGIIHKNLKPQNVLLSVESEEKVTVKLADYSISNILEAGQPSSKDGWIAPEILGNISGKQGNETRAVGIMWTFAADIYSLGYIFYYVLSHGKRPFFIDHGNLHRDRQLSFEDKLFKQIAGSKLLIRAMTDINPSERPPATAILSYHLFLSNEKKLDFLCQVEHSLTIPTKLPILQQCRKVTDDYREKIWCHQNQDSGWMSQLCDTVQSYKNVRRGRNKSKRCSVIELLSFLCSTYGDRDAWDPAMQQAVGTEPSVYMDYWQERFPNLVHYVWLVFQRTKDDVSLTKLHGFYPTDYRFTQKRTIQEITYDPSRVLGKGNGTVVFEGRFQNRMVAVKKIDRIVYGRENAEKEIAMLIKCDQHENVTKYYFSESYNKLDSIFIACDFCHGNLRDWIESKGKCIPRIKHGALSPRDILLQITKGLAHLHEKKVIHRDLKPTNILLQVIADNRIRIKIADFGISKQLPEGREEATRQTCTGSVEWMAPEILKLKYESNGGSFWKMSPATDIFSAGCIFYYIITGGEHPFCYSTNKNVIHTQYNILEYKPQIDLQHVDSKEYLGYIRLIQRMVAKDPEMRPPAAAILKHHIFWSSQKCLDFIANIASIIKFREKRPERTSHRTKLCLDRADQSYSRQLYCWENTNRGWINLVSNDVSGVLAHNQYRDYDQNSILGLLPGIRNLKEHFDQQQEWVRSALGKPPNEFYNYWLTRFPFLVDNVWGNFESIKNEQDWELSGFYSDTFDFDYYGVSEEEQSVFTNYINTSLLP